MYLSGNLMVQFVLEKKKLSNYSYYLNSKQFCNTAQYSAVQKLKNFIF